MIDRLGVEPHVIVVRAERDVLALELRIAAGKNRHDVAAWRRNVVPLQRTVNRPTRRCLSAMPASGAPISASAMAVA